MQYSLKQKIGAVLFDLPRFLWSVRPGWFLCGKVRPWVFMRNRRERLIVDKDGEGAECDWQWTTELHIAKVFPSLGRLFMQRVLKDYPIVLKDAPKKLSDNPDISFIIGHRGLERLPHLLLTLRSIAVQTDVSLECIVVEQSIKEEVKASLPNWVRYIHTPLPRPDLPYCRSWALNVGAREAKGKVLILHDNDFLVPVDYASDVLSKFNSGNEVIQPKRFMFYLSQKGTERIFAKHVKGFINQHDSNNCCHREDRRDAAISSFKNKIASPPAEARNDAMPKGLMAAHEISFRLIIQIAPERIVQNLEAGGSIAVGRDAYFAIGGFDESFIGWGGEDNEFWDRAQTRKVCPYGFLPLVHLWHPGQPDKHYVGGQGRYTGELFENKMKMGREERIKELILLDFGNPRAL